MNMKILEFMNALSKSVRMMNSNPSGSIENKYFWLMYESRPKSIHPTEFAKLVNSESSGWSVMLEPISMGLGKTDWFLSVSVFPSFHNCGEFQKRADVFLAAL